MSSFDKLTDTLVWFSGLFECNLELCSTGFTVELKYNEGAVLLFVKKFRLVAYKFV
jgi:hypothetical protein